MHVIAYVCLHMCVCDFLWALAGRAMHVIAYVCLRMCARDFLWAQAGRAVHVIAYVCLHVCVCDPACGHHGRKSPLEQAAACLGPPPCTCMAHTCSHTRTHAQAVVCMRCRVRCCSYERHDLGVLVERAAHAACLRALQQGGDDDDDTSQDDADTEDDGARQDGGAGSAPGPQPHAHCAEEGCGGGAPGGLAAAASQGAVAAGVVAAAAAGADRAALQAEGHWQRREGQRGGTQVEDTDVEAAVRGHTPAPFWQLHRADKGSAAGGGAAPLGLQVRDHRQDWGGTSLGVLRGSPCVQAVRARAHACMLECAYVYVCACVHMRARVNV